MNLNEAKAYLCSYCDHGKFYDVYTEDHSFEDLDFIRPTPVSVLRPNRPEPPKNPTRKIEWA